MERNIEGRKRRMVLLSFSAFPAANVDAIYPYSSVDGCYSKIDASTPYRTSGLDKVAIYAS